MVVDGARVFCELNIGEIGELSYWKEYKEWRLARREQSKQEPFESVLLVACCPQLNQPFQLYILGQEVQVQDSDPYCSLKDWEICGFLFPHISYFLGINFYLVVVTDVLASMFLCWIETLKLGFIGVRLVLAYHLSRNLNLYVKNCEWKENKIDDSFSSNVTIKTSVVHTLS